jgi:N-ethylmaleimide reductase
MSIIHPLCMRTGVASAGGRCLIGQTQALARLPGHKWPELLVKWRSALSDAGFNRTGVAIVTEPRPAQAARFVALFARLSFADQSPCFVSATPSSDPCRTAGLASFFRFHSFPRTTMSSTTTLLSPYAMRSLALTNRAVMAPMTRSRAIDANTPNALMAEYYGQRASAGLIITEGTSPSANGLGYARIPGLFNAAQVAGWKLTTDAVHAKGGKIFIQFMHTGRVTHVANLPGGAVVIGPTDAVCPGEMYTDSNGMQPHSPPRAMNQADIDHAVGEYATAAKLAIDAGFDGVELHAANGYLIEQFLNANVNTRTDAYGGSSEGRNRFALEVVRASVASIGAERVGIRLSPYGVFNATGNYPEQEAQYLALVKELSALKLAYLHVLDHSAMGTPPVPAAFKLSLRHAFNGPFILAGGFDAASAQKALDEGQADLIAFARPFLANPDLVTRMQKGAALNAPDMSTFYTPGPKGYTDYPALAG